MSGRFARGLLCSPDRKAAVIQPSQYGRGAVLKQAFAIISPEYFGALRISYALSLMGSFAKNSVAGAKAGLISPFSAKWNVGLFIFILPFIVSFCPYLTILYSNEGNAVT
jgi:hypothetical protein